MNKSDFKMNINVYASGSTGNCYRISDGRTTLLLDVGVPIRAIQIKCNFQLSDIDGCLVTHSHNDHIRAASDLARQGLNIYASNGTIEASGLTGHRIKPVKALQQFTVGTFKIMPFDIQHDAPEPLGFLIESKVTKNKLLYFTDSYYLKYKFTGLTHIMAECNYDKQSLQDNLDNGAIDPQLAIRIIKSHMSLEHLIEMLKANDLSKVKQIHLLHLSDSNSNQKLMREEIQKLTGTEVYIC